MESTAPRFAYNTPMLPTRAERGLQRPAGDMVEQLYDKLYGWWESFVLMLPNLGVATLILIISWLISIAVGRGFESLTLRFAHGQALADLVRRIARFAILALGFVVALNVLELDDAAATFLAGAGIVGLALGFAFQDLAANFIAGIGLALRRPMRVGDLVETNGFFGVVDRIHLRLTTLKKPEGQVIRIPNRKIFEEALINYSELGRRRVDVEVGVSYGDDLEKVQELIDSALSALSGRIEDRPVEVFYKEFSDSSINFVARTWFPETAQAGYLKNRSRCVIAIKKAFDENGLVIPFPIRTLDFGIQGGEPLREQLTIFEGRGKNGGPSGKSEASQ